MTFYEELQGAFNTIKQNAISSLVEIEEIEEDKITFIVNDEEVLEKEIDVIEEFLDYIDGERYKLIDITAYKFNITLTYRIKIGKDFESAEEVANKMQDHKDEQSFETWREQKRGVY